MRKGIIFFFFLLQVSIGAAQVHSIEPGLLHPDSLKLDLDSMYRQLQANHPDLYANRDKAGTDIDFRSLRSAIKGPMTRQEFSVLVSSFLSGFRDGHSFVSVDFDSGDFAQYAKSHRFFPLGVRIIDQRLYCADNRYVKEISNGTEITQIQGRAVADILAELKAIWPADGDAAAVAITERLFIYGLWWRYQWGDETEIVIHDNGQKRQLKLSGITKPELLDLMFNKGQPRQLHIFPDYNLAVVEIRNYSSVKQSTAFIDSCFTVIKEKHLTYVALDLRNNGGGNSAIGDYFLSQISRKPYNTIRSKYWRIGPLVMALPADHWMIKAIDKFRERAKKEGEYLVSPDLALSVSDTPKDSVFFSPDHFFLLTSARTFSSAHMTAMAVKCGELGTIIGQPTGERLDLTGEILEYELPRSGLIIVIPTAAYRAACGNGKQVGVSPDVIVTTTIEDIRRGNDPELEYLKKRIREQNK